MEILYNITGTRIEILFEGNAEENKTYILEYNAGKLQAGVYLCKLYSETHIYNHKIIVIK